MGHNQFSDLSPTIRTLSNGYPRFLATRSQFRVSFIAPLP
jgi:hypothetical protein